MYQMYFMPHISLSKNQWAVHPLPRYLHGTEIDLAAVGSYGQNVIGASCGGNLKTHITDFVWDFNGQDLKAQQGTRRMSSLMN